MGWCLAISMPLRSPVAMTMKVAARPTMVPMRRLRRAISVLRRRSRYQQLTPMTNTPPVIQALDTVCRNFVTAMPWKATSQKFTISLRTVSGLNAMPTGCCIQALATRIHHAEMVAPRPVSQVAARWKRWLTLFQPKYIMEMNVASMKKATMPSMASGAPKMSPTNQE